jgi:hypothetical protein
VAQGWRDPCLLSRLETGFFDTVVLVAAPSRRRDRRALERAALVGGSRLVFVDAVAPAVELPLSAPAYA